MKSLRERIVFKRVDKISDSVNLLLFEDKKVTIEYLKDLIDSKDIVLTDFFYEKDVAGTIHAIRDSVEFRELIEEMIEAVKEYRKTGCLVPISKPKKSDYRIIKNKEI